DCSCSKGSVEDKILLPKPPKNYARCGHPVNGLYCQGCTLLQEKIEEDLVTYFQNFQNTFESSDGSTNVVNAPREPFVVKQDHGVNPPHIDECCCECGEALNGIICQRCACKSCGKGAHIGYNCPPKVPIISNPEPCNQTMNNEPPQTLPSFDSTCYSDKEISVPCVSKPNFVEESPNVFNPPPQPPIYSCEFYESNAQYGFDQTQPPQFPVVHPPPQETSIKISYDQENVINSVQTFLRKFNCYSFFETPKVLLLVWDRVFEIKDAFGNKQYKPEDIQELFRKLLDDLQNIHEELAEFINSPGWNRPVVYNDDDDDVDYTIAITPSSSTSLKSVLEETTTFHNSLPEFENVCFDLEISSGSTTTHSNISPSEYEAFSFYDDHIEEIRSGSTTTQSDISLPEYDSFIFDLSNDQFPPTDRSAFTHEEFGDEPAHSISPPEYDCFYFRDLPNSGELISSLNSGICKNLSSTTCVNLPVEDDYSPLLAYVVWIFLTYLTYLVIPPHLHSFGNEDTIFYPGITINCSYSFKLGLSYRCETFKEFNTHRSHLNESPMEMLFSTLFPMDQ
nr:hypothetical protein [Tanacetum cinerariifolium]